jgi:CRP-like cAMP-binding protein
VTALQAVRLRRDTFHRLISEFPEMGQLVTAHMTDRLDELQDDLWRLKARLGSAKPVTRASRAAAKEQGEGCGSDDED